LEIDQIDQKIANFQSGNIDLKEFLTFFEIRNLYNTYYESGNKDLITKMEGIIALLFDGFLEPLFEYDQLRKWQSLTDYVKIVSSNTRKCGTSWPVNCVELDSARA